MWYRKRRLSILCFTLMLCGLILHAPALAEDEIVIVFRQQAAHGGQWVQNAIERFEAKNPGVRVVVDDGGSGYLDQITVQLMGGVAPDIFQGWGTSQRAWATNGFLLDLEPYLEEFFPDAQDLFFPGQWDALKVTDGPLAGLRFGIPMYANVMGPVLYNADLFAEAGIEPPKAGWSWNDLANIASRLVLRHEDGSVGRYGFVTETDHPGWVDAWMRSAGGELFSAEDRDLFLGYTPEAVQTLSYFVELINASSMPDRPSRLGNEYRGFVEERAAMGQIYSSHAVNQVEPNVFFDWDVLPSPVGPAGFGPAMTVVDAYSINAATRHPEYAVKFLMELKSAESSRDQVREKGMIPSTRYPELFYDVAEIVPGKNMVAYLQALNHAVADARVFYSKPSETQTILIGALRSIYSGEMPPQTAMQGVRQQLDAILGK